MAAIFKEECKKLLVNRSNTKLITVNSPTNNKQIKKDHHKDFIEMVNSYNHIFSNLGSVLSGDLQRHFYRLYITDKSKLREETLKIDIHFLKDAFNIMGMDFNKSTSINQVLFLNQLAEALRLSLEDFSLHFGLDYHKLHAQLLDTQSNNLAELRLKHTGLEITFFNWNQLRKKIFSAIDQERPYFSIAKAQVRQYYESDSDFQAAANPIIEGHAKKYFQRVQPKKLAISYEACRLAAKKYLIEECAMLFVLKELNYDFAIYPGALNDALRYIEDKCFKNNSMPWLEYMFKDKMPVKSIFNHAATNSSINITIEKDDRSQAIILNITSCGLNEKIIRPKFLMAFSVFIATFTQRSLDKTSFIPQNKYYGKLLSCSVHPDISEEEFYNTILTNVKILKLTDEKVWPHFYSAYLLFLNDFIYNTEKANSKFRPCLIL
jgi:hypothetical protein